MTTLVFFVSREFSVFQISAISVFPSISSVKSFFLLLLLHVIVCYQCCYFAGHTFTGINFILFSALLNGWQGWWVGACYMTSPDVTKDGFVWANDKSPVSPKLKLWHETLVNPMYEDTCAWMLSYPGFNFKLANYDCEQKSGFICQVDV